MINVAICDELEQDIKHIECLIKESCASLSYDINIINFTSGEDLVKHYTYENIGLDIIFLDIYMKPDNGIKIAKRIREFDKLVKIIFATISVDHALESFCVFPFNYLIKPINKEMFFEVFNQAIFTIDKEKQKIITVKDDKQIYTIFYKDIKYLESCGKKINIYTKKGMLSFNSKLDEVEAKIDDERFLRCHKSFLVNMDYISSVGEYLFVLIENSEVPIKQREFSHIKKSYHYYVVNKFNSNNHRLE
jgi:DNA-binding LytR/AlgR family response regulator